MQNISIKKLLAISFFSIVGLLIATVVIANLAISASEDGISKVSRLSSIYEESYNLHNGIEKIASLAKEYLSDRRSETSAALQNEIGRVKESLNRLQGEAIQSTLSSNLQKIESMLETLKKSFKSGTKEKIENLLEDILSKVEKLKSDIKRVQKESIEKTHKTVMADEALIFALGVASVLVAALLAFYISNLISKNLKTIEDAAASLAGSDGDLTQRIPVIGKNEIGRLAEQFNLFIQKVHETVASAKNNGVENASVAAELSATALEIGRRAEEEAALIADTAKTGEEVFDTLKRAVETVKTSESNVNRATRTLEEANSTISHLIETINSTGAKESDLAHNITQLQEEANGVKEVLDIISDIADQTNLLALNAAIEAARAGEHGRGFAVVADEVRKLAERTQKSLSEITATINLVIQSINDISGQMQSNAKEFESAVEQVVTVEGEIESVNKALKEASAVSRESARSSNEIAKEMQDVIENMREITEISTHNARSVEEIAGAAEHLSRLTEELSHRLKLFKT